MNTTERSEGELETSKGPSNDSHCKQTLTFVNKLPVMCGLKAYCFLITASYVMQSNFPRGYVYPTLAYTRDHIQRLR